MSARVWTTIAPQHLDDAPVIRVDDQGHARIEFDGDVTGHIWLGAHDNPTAWMRQFASRLTLAAREIEDTASTADPAVAEWQSLAGLA